MGWFENESHTSGFFSFEACGWVLLSIWLNLKIRVYLVTGWLMLFNQELWIRNADTVMCYCSWSAEYFHNCCLSNSSKYSSFCESEINKNDANLHGWDFLQNLSALKRLPVFLQCSVPRSTPVLFSRWSCRIIAGRQILPNRQNQVIKNVKNYCMIS